MPGENEIHIIRVADPFPDCAGGFGSTDLEEMFGRASSGEGDVGEEALVICCAEHEDSFFGSCFDGGFEVGDVGCVLGDAFYCPGHGDYVDFFVDCCADSL